VILKNMVQDCWKIARDIETWLGTGQYAKHDIDIRLISIQGIQFYDKEFQAAPRAAMCSDEDLLRRVSGSYLVIGPTSSYRTELNLVTLRQIIMHMSARAFVVGSSYKV
jgi:hypothetical protein